MGSKKHNVVLDRVKDIRTEKKLSQADLSRRTGILQTTVSYIERKKKGTFEQAQMLARGLGVRIVELSWDGHNSVNADPVVAGNQYDYIGEVQIDGEPEVEVSRETRIERKVEDQPEIADVPNERVLRVEVSEPILERFDRVLDIVEFLVSARR